MTEALLFADPSARLEAAYRAIHAQRMQGVAIVNAALDVKAVGFAPWEGRWLGVMVTPWCMNLMLVPHDPQAWTALRPGEKRKYSLPAGEFEFIGGLDPAIGEYQMCSLFSPMLDFHDMPAAELTAQLALEALFDSAHAPQPQRATAAAPPATTEDAVAASRNRASREGAVPASKFAAVIETSAPAPSEGGLRLPVFDAPLTKRGFLRGTFLRRGDRG